MFQAIACNDFVRFKACLSTQHSVRNEIGYERPLHRVVNANWARMLISHGADVNATDRDGNTPLMTCNNVAVARVLVKHGANVNHVNHFGETVLFQDLSAEVLEYCISLGADVNARNKNCNTPLFWCENETRARVLIKNGADVNAQNEVMPILHSIFSLPIVMQLVDAGANVHARMVCGGTVLHAYPCGGEMVNYYVSKGVDVNAVNKLHETALFAMSSLDVVEALIEAGIDVNARNVNGYTALNNWSIESYVKIVLIRAGIDDSGIPSVKFLHFLTIIS